MHGISDRETWELLGHQIQLVRAAMDTTLGLGHQGSKLESIILEAARQGSTDHGLTEVYRLVWMAKPDEPGKGGHRRVVHGTDHAIEDQQRERARMKEASKKELARLSRTLDEHGLSIRFFGRVRYGWSEEAGCWGSDCRHNVLLEYEEQADGTCDWEVSGQCFTHGHPVPDPS